MGIYRETWPIRMPRNLWIAEGFPPIIFNVHPMTIAFGYFTKSEVLLSIWVFNLLAILQVGLFNRLGVEMGSPDIYCGFHPATAWQGFGGLDRQLGLAGPGGAHQEDNRVGHATAPA